MTYVDSERLGLFPADSGLQQRFRALAVRDVVGVIFDARKDVWGRHCRCVADVF